MLIVTAILPSLICVFLVAAIRKLVRGMRSDSLLSRIPGPNSPSYIKGHMDKLFSSKDGPQFHSNLTEKYDRVTRVKGFFGEEQLYISDPLALQSIIVKDQDNFEETAVFIENNKIIFGEGLVATTGEHHKKQRRLINPVFSLQRLRSLVPTFYEVAHRLKNAITTTAPQSKDHQDAWVVDMAEWFSRAALESVGQAGLGYSFDPLDSLSANPYTKAVRALIPTMFRIAPLRLLTPFATRLGSPKLRRFLLDLVPIEAVQLLKRMSDQMDGTCREILRAKRTAAKSDDILSGTGVALPSDMIGNGKDVMSILLRANESASSKEKLSEAELLGQMNVLIFGAQDTTSSALSRTLFLLSRPSNYALQSQLRSEISKALEESDGKDLEYDEFTSLPLLDAILKETLRLYPPVPFVRRITKRTTPLPLSRPILLSDGHTYTSSIFVPKDMTIWINIAGANRSKDIWGEDADEWKPQRWLGDLGHTSSGGELDSNLQHSASQRKLKLPGVYSGMLTFFGGGRSCVGYRFALIEMKIILITLLSSFRFTATNNKIVWNLSQILSPSFIKNSEGSLEQQGMPIGVEVVARI